jgi:Zn-dependent M28 family amino/carboxypeptidase
VHANDDVRAFLLERVSAIARGHDFVTVDDDLRTNVSIASPAGFGVYFEGTNVLVKVDGADPAFSLANGAVLFSAHYDSVSTAPGATDDGMGVASLIGVLEYLAKNRPRRTAVFNLNNGEEDGLHGAHA